MDLIGSKEKEFNLKGFTLTRGLTLVPMSKSVVLIIDQSKPILGEKSLFCYELISENDNSYVQRLSTTGLS